MPDQQSIDAAKGLMALAELPCPGTEDTLHVWGQVYSDKNGDVDKCMFCDALVTHKHVWEPQGLIMHSIEERPKGFGFTCSVLRFGRPCGAEQMRSLDQHPELVPEEFQAMLPERYQRTEDQVWDGTQWATPPVVEPVAEPPVDAES